MHAVVQSLYAAACFGLSSACLEHASEQLIQLGLQALNCRQYHNEKCDTNIKRPLNKIDTTYYCLADSELAS